MRIAFDLDDTLVPTTVSFASGARAAPFPAHFISRERLRHGAVELLRRIAERHDLWIYTTSLRSPLRVKLWLRCHGVRIAGVINAETHLQRVYGTAYQVFSKAPGLFNIDVLVDDALGVARECRVQGVRCIPVSHADHDWADKVAHELQL